MLEGYFYADWFYYMGIFYKFFGSLLFLYFYSHKIKFEKF